MTEIPPFLRAALALSPMRPAFWLQGELGVGNRIVRRWLASEEAPPLGIAEKMVILLRARAKEADMAANQLETLIATGSLRKSQKVPKGTYQPHPQEAERTHRKRLGLDFDE